MVRKGGAHAARCRLSDLLQTWYLSREKSYAHVCEGRGEKQQGRWHASPSAEQTRKHCSAVLAMAEVHLA